MLFLYDLPDSLMAVTVVGTIVGVTYAAYFVFHRGWRPAFTDEQRNLAMTVLTVVATINALLLAFLAVSVWESFGAAETAVVEEANTIGELSRDLAIFDSAQSRDARQQLRGYANMVMTVEWRDMQRGHANLQVWNAFDRLFVQRWDSEMTKPAVENTSHEK
jgi:heme/copper-type cytochrome/quinol oxidase subunit 2